MADRAVRILVVDDDEDTRDLITFALQAHHYGVTPVASGEGALEAMRQASFDLVITDYDMPGLTGAEMLKKASGQGLMKSSAALVITAHPDPRGIPDETPLLAKPIDIERLLVQVRAILPSAKARPARKKTAAPADGALLDLVLYVSSRSPASGKAQNRMDEVLSEFDRSLVRYEVCDLFQHAASAERDRVVFTPTLVKRSPAPRAWILGDLAHDDVVRDLLTMCGVPVRKNGA